MQCSKCGNPKVIYKREQSGQLLCKDCFIESIEKKVIKTVKKEKLLDKGDKVLVALSGGKDSVTTLEILNSFREMNVIDLCAVTVDEGIANYRQEGVDIAKRHAERFGIEHKVVSLKEDYGITLDEIMQRPNHKGEEFTVKIKPLREIPEREIGLYVVAKELEVHFDSCPYAMQSFRGEVSEVINQLAEKHPTIKYSTLRGYDKIKGVLKKEMQKEYAHGRCKRCGEPSANELCKACSFLEELGV